MGAVHGYIDVSPREVQQAVPASMTILTTTQQTVTEAYQLQEELLDRGVPLEQLDALIAAPAREHGGVFATADRQFWHESVRPVLAVARDEHPESSST